MLDLGTVLPGSKVYIPVNTFDSNDPSASVTATNWANTDCHVHKDGGTTQRASSAGETLSIDFDTVTGNHILELDLADNTTANFYEAGSVYHVRIEGVTVDAGTINAWIGMFRIGYPGAILDTTIATLSSQTSFTLEDGSTDDDAYNGMLVIIHDLASAVQVATGVVSDYTGSTKTVTLKADPGVFTMAAGDNISFMMPALVPTTLGNTLDVTATGAAGIDWANVENQSTSVNLSSTTTNLVNTTTTNTDMRGTDSAALASNYTAARAGYLDNINGHTAQTGDSFARLGTPADTDIATDIANVSNQVGNLAVGSGGIATTSDGNFTLTTGTASAGTETSTEALDGTVHTIDTPSPNLEFYYQFDVGVNGVATEVRWDGYVGSNGDVCEVYGYDWVAAGWVQIGSITGKNSNTVEEHIYILTSAMTGTGANAGLVRFRFESSGGDVATDVNTDRILCEYTSVAAEALILHSGIAQAGASSTITLDSGANANDDFYNNARVVIKSGTGVEQERIIVDYNGTTKVATISPPWTTNPDSTSAFDVEAASVHTSTDFATVKVGIVAAATSTTVTLDSLASSTNDFYNGDALEIHDGTGKGQVRVITDYNGTTKVATVSRAWTTTPDTTSEYFIQEVACDVESVAAQTASATATVDFDDLASILADTGTDGVALSAAAIDDVWDEVITKAAHNVSNSAAQMLRLAKQSTNVTESAVNDPGAAATTTVFNTDLTEVDDHWNDCILVFTSGSLTGQAYPILDFANINGQITLSEAATAAPADNDEFVIVSMHVHPISQIQSGLATEAKQDIIDTNVDTLIVNVPDVISLANINAEVDTAFTTQMADSVSTDGSIATREQALYMITQMLTEFAISGTTYTVKKVDGSTTLMTFTLDDGTNPTSITRTT